MEGGLIKHIHRWTIETPTAGENQVEAVCKGCETAKKLEAYWNETPKFHKPRRAHKAKA